MMRCQETGKTLVKPQREILTGQHYETCRKKKNICVTTNNHLKKSFLIDIVLKGASN